MKMALQYWHAKGETRQRFLTFRNGYHGDTFGAMSVCDPTTPCTACGKAICRKTCLRQPGRAASTANGTRWIRQGFARLMALYRHEIAAVILEPIVQGAGGMRMYHPEWLRAGLEDVRPAKGSC